MSVEICTNYVKICEISKLTIEIGIFVFIPLMTEQYQIHQFQSRYAIFFAIATSFPKDETSNQESLAGFGQN